ncbi:MAG TPA: DUF2889 domain-containing protein [Dermatophilaceae bacterium]|nr:DUF2889 domain-containing protein [Dermatophilaceae bacterium]
MHVRGRARDLLTPASSGPARVLAHAGIDATIARDRTIRWLASQPVRPSLQALVGARGGGNLRGHLGAVVPQDRAAGNVLHLLLDDLAVLTLISWYAFSQWVPVDRLLAAAPPQLRGGMVGACYGLRAGSTALDPAGLPRHSDLVRPVPPLHDGRDPWAWHDIEPDAAGVAMRRARRIDVWVDGSTVMVDGGFQDSMTSPDGRRRAVHEYLFAAAADRAGMLTRLSADPRVLPYTECPAAAAAVGRFVGAPLNDLRRLVLHDLGGPRGCTHLNDALRGLADVPGLAARLNDSVPATYLDSPEGP